MDEFIDKLIAFRDEKRMLENQLKEAKNECENIKNIAYYNEEQYRKCSLEKQRLARDYRAKESDFLRLKNDYNKIVAKCSTLEKDLAALSLENKNLKEEYSYRRAESRNTLSSYSVKEAKMLAVRELVEQLIIYAEKEDKSVAREIRIALDKKMANGFIAKDVLTPDWKERFESLGREKKTPIQNIFNINKSVGTFVAHSDEINLKHE